MKNDSFNISISIEDGEDVIANKPDYISVNILCMGTIIVSCCLHFSEHDNKGIYCLFCSEHDNNEIYCIYQ